MTTEQLEAGRRWLERRRHLWNDGDFEDVKLGYWSNLAEEQEPALLAFLAAYQAAHEAEKDCEPGWFARRLRAVRAETAAWLALIEAAERGADDE